MTKPEVPFKRRSTRSKTVMITCKEDLLDETPRDINGVIVNNNIKDKTDSENLLNEKIDHKDYPCQKQDQQEETYPCKENPSQIDRKRMPINSIPESKTDCLSANNYNCYQETNCNNRSFSPMDQTKTISKSLSNPIPNTQPMNQANMETKGSVLKSNNGLYKKREESSKRTFCFSELISAFQTIEKKVQQDPYIAYSLLKKFKGTEEQYCSSSSNGYRTEKICFPSIRNNPFMKLGQSQTVNSPSIMFYLNRI